MTLYYYNQGLLFLLLLLLILDSSISLSAIPSTTLRRPPHFLILTSDTGGGHRASAMSLLSALNNTSPYDKIVTSHGWDYTDKSKTGEAKGFTYELLDMWTAAGEKRKARGEERRGEAKGRAFVL